MRHTRPRRLPGLENVETYSACRNSSRTFNDPNGRTTLWIYCAVTRCASALIVMDYAMFRTRRVALPLHGRIHRP